VLCDAQFVVVLLIFDVLCAKLLGTVESDVNAMIGQPINVAVLPLQPVVPLAFQKLPQEQERERGFNLLHQS
jgi:hypothetical protein